MILQDPYFYAVAVAGLILGSFAGALAHRLPRGESVVTQTRSACPACKKDLGVPDLVPVFSWLWLRGRCRACGARISWRYPAAELATTALCLGAYALYGFTPQVLALFALAPVLVAIADIDFAHKIIPDRLTLAVLLCGAAALLLGGLSAAQPVPFFLAHGMQAAGGAALYAGGAWALRRVFMALKKTEPLGLGDVKFFGAAGFWLGMDAQAAAGFLTLAGGIGVVMAPLWKRFMKEDAFPFGPALVAAFAVMAGLLKPFT